MVLNVVMGFLFLSMAVAVFVKLRGRRLLSELAMFLLIVILVLEGLFNRAFNMVWSILLIGFLHYLIIYNLKIGKHG
ncbi:hypothetical protein DRQ17_06590 [bacterium]|nr:MAG: hypothetical protein DRQ17_06590 [bacterium]